MSIQDLHAVTPEDLPHGFGFGRVDHQAPIANVITNRPHSAHPHAIANSAANTTSIVKLDQVRAA
jgi:hypothetical protein